MISIRLFEEKDWPMIWKTIQPVFRAGETYSVPRNISEQDAYKLWIKKPQATFVAADHCDRILGTYYIKPNQPGAGSHVCNCGYIVAAPARRKGLASRMCAHSQQEAIQRGFLAMQFNLVVSTNQVAIHVWEKLGFVVIGTVPRAFNHPKFGLVDALIMHKTLT